MEDENNKIYIYYKWINKIVYIYMVIDLKIFIKNFKSFKF